MRTLKVLAIVSALSLMCTDVAAADLESTMVKSSIENSVGDKFTIVEKRLNFAPFPTKYIGEYTIEEYRVDEMVENDFVGITVATGDKSFKNGDLVIFKNNIYQVQVVSTLSKGVFYLPVDNNSELAEASKECLFKAIRE